MATAVTTFDYGTLTAVERAAVEDCTREVKDFVRKTTRDAHRVGLKLKAAKKLLGHGRFLAWLRAELGWSADTAQRLMKVADAFTEMPHAAAIGLTALYLLAGDSIPEEARKEAVGRAAAGEIVTTAVAKQIATRYAANESAAPARKPNAAKPANTAVPVANDAATVANSTGVVAPKARGGTRSIASPQTVRDAAVAENTDAATATGGMSQDLNADLHVLIDGTLALLAAEDFVVEVAVGELVEGWSAARVEALAELVNDFLCLLAPAPAELRRLASAAPA